MYRPHTLALLPLLSLSLLACTTDSAGDDGGFTTFMNTSAEAGDGDGDGDAETGEGEGDGDGDPGATCGNGMVESGEECDLGPENSPTGSCTPECLIAECGDGYVYEGFEECDDANSVNTDDCVAQCKLATCGDGFEHAGVEMCDDGNTNEADGCNTMCLPGSCGDGILQDGEQCDDGNADNTDECAACQLAYCGDGFIQAGLEECDDGNDLDNDTCIPVFCKTAFCGDGYLQDGVEVCDDGNLEDGDACPTSCADAFCGDGFVHDGFETCDDGNNVSNDGCTDVCELECGLDCWGPGGCITDAGRCIKFTCTPGNESATACDSCFGWEPISKDQWLNQGYCGDIIDKYREVNNVGTQCGQAPVCCDSIQACGGGDNAWHFHDGVNNYALGPCLGCQNDVNCTNWDFIDNSTYTRITACEKGG